MTQATTAVANTIPAGVGAAIGIGMTYTMLGSWGYSRSRTTTAVLVSGVWNSFIKRVVTYLWWRRRSLVAAGTEAPTPVGVEAT